INAMITLARSEPGVPVLPADTDSDPWLFNCLNGTLDLRTLELRPHCRNDLITKLAPVEYIPDAACPLWLRCLNRWMNKNDDLIGYLQRVIGYALTGSVAEHCLWFLHGLGANGKTTFLLTILAMMADYAFQAV